MELNGWSSLRPHRSILYALRNGSRARYRSHQWVVSHFPSKAASIMACQPPLMAPGALIQATTISSVGSRIAAMAARATAKDEGGSSNEAVPISCWSACATRSIMLFIDLAPPVHPRKFIAIKPVPLNRVFQMLARLGDVIYSVGCIAAAAILGLGIFDYWFGIADRLAAFDSAICLGERCVLL